MNLSLPNLRLHVPSFNGGAKAREQELLLLNLEDDSAQLRRIRSLLSLFALYAGALLTVILIPDGADIGCILAGIAGHVLYASGKTAFAWRDASWLADARARVAARRHILAH